MNTTWLGIDPGISGAVASLRPDGAVLIYDTPTVESQVRDANKKSGFKTRREYDRLGMSRILRGEWHAAKNRGLGVAVAIERQQPMPSTGAEREEFGAGHRKGTVGAFRSGLGYGIWLGLIAAYLIEPEEYMPRSWRARYITGDDKSKRASVETARRLFPQALGQLKRWGDHGRAEALLIGAFGRSKNVQESLF